MKKIIRDPTNLFYYFLCNVSVLLLFHFYILLYILAAGLPGLGSPGVSRPKPIIVTLLDERSKTDRALI